MTGKSLRLVSERNCVAEGPHPIDVYVGGRLRIRRKVVGVSQQALAEKLGVSFQQIQKYERGANRISASKLFEAAAALGVTVGYFFEGLPEPRLAAAAEGGARPPMRATPSPRAEPELLAVISRIKSHRLRKQLMSLVGALAVPGGDGEDG